MGLTLADIDLGGVDAESDVRLADYFVTTPYVRSALAGRRTLFLARKGGGKSALFTQLPRLAGDADREDLSVRLITPDQYAWAALKEYKEQGLMPEQAHTNAWKLTLAVEVCGALLAAERVWNNGSGPALDRAAKFLDDNFGTVNPGLLQTATSMVKGLKSFNFSAFGFGAGLTRGDETEQALTPAVSEELLRLASEALWEHRLIIGIDRLDDSWDGSEEARSLLVGLLKAAKELNDKYATSEEDCGLRVDVFLRSDIYDSLKFDDKDKHRASEENIVWTPDLLKEMVERRLPSGLSVDDLFEPGDMRGSTTPFNYIVRRTFLRPREVLQFLEECVRQAGEYETVIMKDDIRAAEETYSGWKVSDLKQEYLKVLPFFDRLLESFRQEVHRYDTLDHLAVLLRRKVPDLVDLFGERFLMEALFECSVIGVRLAGAGSTRYKSEDISLALPTAGSVYVHQSLHRGLNIRETRRPADEAPQGNPLDRLSVDLYALMMASLPVQDMTFLGAQPNTIVILESDNFDDYAKALGIEIEIDDSISGLKRPNILAGRRYEINALQFTILKFEMQRMIVDRGYTIADYLRGERRAGGAAAGPS
jgi:hypothetical protein